MGEGEGEGGGGEEGKEFVLGGKDEVTGMCAAEKVGQVRLFMGEREEERREEERREEERRRGREEEEDSIHSFSFIFSK